MFNDRCIAVLCAFLVATTFAAAKEKNLVNADTNGLALHGYDPVAYFTDNAPVIGDPKYKATYKGSMFYFSSDAHKKLFKKDPARYAPQFGGYCAMAVSLGQLEDADPKMFTIHHDKLLVQRNEKAHQMFSSNPDVHHQKADQQWPRLVEINGK
jgi:YHS domain-containing protein